jgi:uncharacterized protein (DUF1778 family)
MALSQAQKDAHRRWNEKNYEQIAIRLPKGEKEKIKSFATAANLSLAQYIWQACYEKAGQEVPKTE